MPNSRNSAKAKTAKQPTAASTSYVREHYESTGNIYLDMGKPADEANNLFLRSKLMIAIQNIITKCGWTHSEAAKIIGVARPRVTELLSSRIDLFSLDTLVKYLNKLGKRVTVSVVDGEVA